MKLKGLLTTATLIAMVAIPAMAQNASSGGGPTESDMYCSGFVTKDAVPTTSKITAGWEAPDQVEFSTNDLIYLKGGSYAAGQKYEIVRRTKDVNAYEVTKDQKRKLAAVGMQYEELGRVNVVDVQKGLGIAKVELSCDAFQIGDIAVPWQDRPAVEFKNYPPMNRFAPANGKTTGHIAMGSEYGAIMGTKDKVYLDIGSSAGLKPGDYLRATRTYEQTVRNDTDGLSTKAAVPDISTYSPLTIAEHTPTTNEIRRNAADLPRRTLGEMVVLHTTPVSATAMITRSLEQIQVGDGVELMEEPPAPPPPPPPPAPVGPSISCSADPNSVTAGDNVTVRCNGNSPDGRPLTYTFVSDQGSIAPNSNVATLHTAGANGTVTVMATVKDDRNMSASTNVPVTVQPPAAPPSPSQAGDFAFLANSAHVDNKAKAILDGVALRLNREANSSVLIVGYTAVSEKASLGLMRANNAKTYLTKDKGVDASRVVTKDGGKGGRRAEIWFVPAGATVPTVNPVSAPAAPAPAKPAAKKPATATAKKPATAPKK